MRVFDLLSWLHPNQICYSDTDSVMRIYNTTNPLRKHPSNNAVDLPTRVHFGKGLGEWENELEKGEFINECVVGGAKSYLYRTNTGKSVIKQKGIPMDSANSKLITFETMRYMVLTNTILKSEDGYTFRWDAKSKDVATKF